MSNILRITTVLAASSALCGCAVMDSIHWKFPGPGDSQVFSTDAKQRHLIMINDTSAKPGEQMRVCAEAAPDAFSAFSSSLTGSFGIGSAERKAEASNAFAETAATIERTQTVNLLRESMYRTCERWLSGALDKDLFLTLAARDNRAMVAVLAIEQLTGVVKPPSTIISGPAVRAMATHSEKLFEALDRYGKERAAAEKTETEAKAAFDAANVANTPAAGATAVKICSLSAPPTSQPDATNYQTCTAAKSKADAATAVADSARTRENAVLKDLGKLASGLSAGTDTGTINAGGYSGGPSRPDQLTIAAVGASVEKIALTAGIDEALMFCIGYLNSDDVEPTTRTSCNKILEDKARNDEALRLRTYNYTLSSADEETSVIFVSDYQKFRTRMAAAISVTPPGDWATLWKQFLTVTPTPSKLCYSQIDCKNKFAGLSPLTSEFRKDQTQYEAAVDQWLAALKAKGVNI